MQALSKAILEQLAQQGSGSKANSPSGRVNPRLAPISSSRDDPLPNPNETFPAPLPHVELPYELALLDNLFINPMSSHNKASDYTNGNKARCQSKMTDTRSGISGVASRSALTSTLLGTPQGFPPSAFGGVPVPDGDFGLMGIQAYGMAAQMGQNGTANGQPKDGPSIASQTMGDGAMSGEAGFDLLSFLMDEEGGLGPTWDALDVPADYSLWS
jgi:hypothetical protein